MASLIFKRECPVNNSISVMIPTIGEIMENEDDYYALVHALTAMPIDYMVPLDDAGIDFETLNEYELFLVLFGGLRNQDTRLLFGDLDLSKFVMVPNEQNNTVILRDEEHDITIDRAIHGRIAATLRSIHHLEKNRRKPGNAEAKAYMLERARKKMKRHRKQDSHLENLIVALVNTAEFKYDFESVRNLTIFQFNESVRQVISKIDFDNRMHGIYSGTVSAKDMKKEDLSWIKTK